MRRRRRNEAVTRRFPLYAIRVASVLGFSAVGFLLARVLRGRPVLTAVTLGLVLASGALERL
jgi:Na+/citrate or Na+/malate symporter